MKTLTRMAIVTALFALPLSVMAESDRGYGYGMKSGQHMMGSGFYHYCENCGTYQSEGTYDRYKVISEKKAKERFETFLKNHLKGFTITKMGKREMPRGTMHWVVIKDQNGNEMELHMNPWGHIRGPFIR